MIFCFEIILTEPDVNLGGVSVGCGGDGRAAQVGVFKVGFIKVDVGVGFVALDRGGDGRAALSGRRRRFKVGVFKVDM